MCKVATLIKAKVCCTVGEEQTQETAARPLTDAQMLAAEFPAIDAGLIEAMMEDQGGDAADVRFALRVRLSTEVRVITQQRSNWWLKSFSLRPDLASASCAQILYAQAVVPSGAHRPPHSLMIMWAWPVDRRGTPDSSAHTRRGYRRKTRKRRLRHRKRPAQPPRQQWLCPLRQSLTQQPRCRISPCRVQAAGMPQQQAARYQSPTRRLCRQRRRAAATAARQWWRCRSQLLQW